MYFSPFIAKLLKYTKFNNHLINLVESQQLYYESIKLVELKTLKIYIETNITNSFIKFSKFPTNALIYFLQKLDRSFW